ncbi:unnamed protein product [Sympodiomycopsis kandeliae]
MGATRLGRAGRSPARKVGGKGTKPLLPFFLFLTCIRMHPNLDKSRSASNRPEYVGIQKSTSWDPVAVMAASGRSQALTRSERSKAGRSSSFSSRYERAKAAPGDQPPQTEESTPATYEDYTQEARQVQSSPPDQDLVMDMTSTQDFNREIKVLVGKAHRAAKARRRGLSRRDQSRCLELGAL